MKTFMTTMTKIKVLFMLQIFLLAAAGERKKLQPSARRIVFPLKNYLGGPSTRVRLGNPPQDFNFIVDTGSSVIWVPCQTSSSGLGTPVFNPKQSSPLTCSDNKCKTLTDDTLAKCNNSANTCVYDLVYGVTPDTSAGTSGYYLSDLVHLDNLSTAARIVFGCSTSFAGQLQHRAFDAVLGMGPSMSSFISQLNAVGVSGMVFTLCVGSSGNGILALGEATDPGLVYTPLVPSENYYQINLEGIAVNGQKLSIDSSVFRPSQEQYTFADSGTTFAFLADGAFDPFVNAIRAAAPSSARPVLGGNDQLCFLTAASIDTSFPSVQLYFAGGAIMMLQPRNYLTYVDESKYCIAWFRNTGKQVTLLGGAGLAWTGVW